jgi:hypothetical protein
MSGPIVRRYGFPNFEKIFGERPLEHGTDDADETDAATKQAASAQTKAEESSAKSTSTPERKSQ